jgi:hypothetical protein
VLSTEYELAASQERPFQLCANNRRELQRIGDFCCSTVKYSRVQYSAVQCSSEKLSTVPCSNVKYSTVQCSAVQYSTVQHTRLQRRALWLLAR